TRAEDLRTRLAAEGLAPDREAWLEAQLAALATWLGRQAGERLDHRDLVEALHGVRPAYGESDVYRAAHEELDALLPGAGPLAERYDAYLTSTVVPPDLLLPAAAAVATWLRELTRARFGLPDEEVVLSVVEAKPWGAFQTWRGSGRSEVALNADLPLPFGRLVQLLAHECYPGHHTDRVRKEAALADRPETRLSLSCAPECTLAEGLAELALRGLGLGDWGTGAGEVAAGLGLAYDGALGEAVARAVAPLNPVRQDAALLLHAEGATEAEAGAHLQRWLLLSPGRAAKQVQFALTHPAYSSTYTEGERLVAAWLDRADDERNAFRHLLDAQLTPAALRVSGTGGPAGRA
ncbi:MAG: DUF885 domain-containing protein, partial [Actinomycetota bacterium]|nr:DUF885 domain-containing protein [Actinomycetota bacterium]